MRLSARASASREGAALGAGRTRGGAGLRGATGGRRRAESALCGAFRRTHRRWSPASSSRGLAPLGHTPAAGGRGTSSLPRKRGPGRGIGPPRAKPDIGDRVIASVPYLLPLLDGLRYGKFFFREFPQTYVLLAPLEPLIKAYYTLPFASLVVFFGLYYGIVQNYNFSRFVRFQAMQTILLDILLIIPSLLENFLLRGKRKRSPRPPDASLASRCSN